MLAERTSSGLSATGVLGLEYWSALGTRLIEGPSPLKPHKPLPRSWTNFAIGRSGFHLAAAFVRKKQQIGIWLVVSGPLAKPHFHLLAKDTAAIERELGTELEWQELPDQKQSYVVLQRSADPTRREDWPDQHDWLRDKLEAFQRVFGPRIKALKSGSGDDAE